jgi:hypothetical protein
MFLSVCLVVRDQIQQANSSTRPIFQNRESFVRSTKSRVEKINSLRCVRILQRTRRSRREARIFDSSPAREPGAFICNIGRWRVLDGSGRGGLHTEKKRDRYLYRERDLDVVAAPDCAALAISCLESRAHGFGRWRRGNPQRYAW